MRSKKLRLIVVGLTVFLTTFDSGTAFGLFGCFRGGGFRGGWCGGGYSSGCSSWGSSGCGGRVVYRGGWSDCGGGCGGYVSSSCGCTDCGGCSGCGSSGTVIEHSQPTGVYVPQQPATVNKQPSEPTMAPRLYDPQQPAGVGRDTMQTMPDTRATTPRSTEGTLPPGGAFGPTSTMPEKAGGTTPTQPDVFELGPTRGAGTPTTATPPTTTPTTSPTTEFPDLFPTTPTTGGGGAPPVGGGAAPGGGATPAGGGATPAGGATDTKQDDPLGDLFKSIPPAGGTTPPPGGGAVDPFKSASVLHEDGGLASEANREWLDNTGLYKTRARLLSFLDGHVRLLKDNGRTTTVPLGRLSAGDLEFVNRQASAQRAVQVAEAAEVVGTPLAAN